MKDIFDAKISCKNCNVEMQSKECEKQGILVRAVQCPRCNDKIFHPTDIERVKQYNDLKRKTYNVKLRVVGNSHAVSIPKEIVDFIGDIDKKMKSHMDNMVKLAFEDFGKISLNFFDDDKRRKARW